MRTKLVMLVIGALAGATALLASSGPARPVLAIPIADQCVLTDGGSTFTFSLLKWSLVHDGHTWSSDDTDDSPEMQFDKIYLLAKPKTNHTLKFADDHDVTFDGTVSTQAKVKGSIRFDDLDSSDKNEVTLVDSRNGYNKVELAGSVSCT